MSGETYDIHALSFVIPYSRLHPDGAISKQRMLMSLYMFDKDACLLQPVRTWFFFHRPPHSVEEQVLRRGMFERLAQLRAAGHKIAIATNQPWVADDIMTLQQAEYLVENCAAKAGGVSAWLLSPFDPKAKLLLNGEENPYTRDDESRKPRPGMILRIMEQLGSGPEETIMVGNTKTDKKTARAAGVSYIPVKKFLKSKEV